MIAPAPGNVSLVFVELGAAIVALALLARVAGRWGLSAIPLYLLAVLGPILVRAAEPLIAWRAGPRPLAGGTDV